VVRIFLLRQSSLLDRHNTGSLPPSPHHALVLASCSEVLAQAECRGNPYGGASPPSRPCTHLRCLRSGEAAHLPGECTQRLESSNVPSRRLAVNRVMRFRVGRSERGPAKMQRSTSKMRASRVGFQPSGSAISSPGVWALLQFRRCSSGRAFHSWPPTRATSPGSAAALESVNG
jgi:hypothetical protein